MLHRLRVIDAAPQLPLLPDVVDADDEGPLAAPALALDLEAALQVRLAGGAELRHLIEALLGQDGCGAEVSPGDQRGRTLGAKLPNYLA